MVVGFALGGCGVASPDTLARPVAVTGSQSASAAASSAASASPSVPVDRGALLARAKAGAIAVKGLSALGVSTGPKDDKAVAYDVTAACGKRTPADQSDPHAAYNRTWSAQGWWVSNTAIAYATAAGTDVVAQVKTAVESCTTYDAETNGQVTLHGAIDLPAYPGIDARYAYCQTSKRTDSTFVSCVAFVAKGSLVSSVWTVHGSSRGDNASGVKQVAAIAAEALRKV